VARSGDRAITRAISCNLAHRDANPGNNDVTDGLKAPASKNLMYPSDVLAEKIITNLGGGRTAATNQDLDLAQLEAARARKAFSIWASPLSLKGVRVTWSR